jgi:hypothetical protein
MVLNGKISDYFELQKFQTSNTKALAKDKKSQYHSYHGEFVKITIYQRL